MRAPLLTSLLTLVALGVAIVFAVPAELATSSYMAVRSEDGTSAGVSLELHVRNRQGRESRELEKRLSTSLTALKNA